MPIENTNSAGLGKIPRSEWKAPDLSLSEEPISLLKPGSDAHSKVLDYLMKRLDHSEDRMVEMQPRWVVAERQTQAYINLEKFEETLKKQNDAGFKPKAVPLIIPYSYATLSTIVTYLLHTFLGRRPIFQVSSHKDSTVDSSRNMETLLQFNADYSRFGRQFLDFLWAGQLYGVQILRTDWADIEREITVSSRAPAMPGLPPEAQSNTTITRSRKRVKIYQGNMSFSQDPFLFFPDSNVPMKEVNRRGEFVFWRTFEPKFQLLLDEDDGILRYVKEGGDSLPKGRHNLLSDRALRARGEGNPGENSANRHGHAETKVAQIDQGTVWIIPRELGLGESTRPEMWLFTVMNRKQIVQAEPMTADHGMHPVAVAEPFSMGPSFGSLGMADFIGPIQNLVSWFFNSHTDNVRKVLNDQIVINPMYVETQDLKESEPGRIIRLKAGAYGIPIRDVIQQLPVTDVTTNHVKDAELLIRIGQMLSGVTENVLGLQDSGGRKTATEVRTTSEAAASRLAAMTRIISSQAMVDLTDQWVSNNQQWLTEDFFLNVVGQEGIENPIWIGPDMINGPFNYPVHDGTLPLDRVALMDVWKEVFGISLQDQELRQKYSIPKMFEWIAELGGARNIESMRLTAQPDAQIQQSAQAGNAATPGEVNAATAQVDPATAFLPQGQV